ncbi:oligosaccharide flippase family protein [Methanoculleus sp. YWC-01]|jgi:O-antigen/teichoic acid export membrane protein|uniref:Oligosaccharide flippase family protein n=1 Tax=Methanoculleus nereidis TaxID=2735141 RepID=A0ABU3Z318_9EURY|nr:oligosaccharide flippase family protein [Methanoculleus sp. YWC-01]MDV4343029.1 oligosaccharide flippase family protein [Methanoculleus sp. YWC-01]
MPTETNQRFAAQFPRNLAANIAYFLVNIVIGVLLVPYFVSTLGVAAYGLIPLATSITGYVAIVVQSLNTAVSRFLTVDLQREDYTAANRTFNTALFAFSAILLLMVPVVVAVAYFAPAIFNVPAGQETGAILLFLGVSAALLIRSWSGNFTVQLFAYNRLDLQNLVNLTNIVVQVGLIVLLFTLLGPDLALIGGAYLAGAVVASGVSIVLAHRICPYLRISKRSFDRTKLKDIGGMGGWVVVDQMGHLLLFQIDLIVVNLLFGATLAGEYAIALQWGLLMLAIAGTVASVFTPTILTYYALKQTETLITITRSAVKFIGLTMALPAGLICGFAPQLLTVWVGAEHANLAPLMVLLTAHLAVNMSVQPLFAVNVAHNKVRIPGIVTTLLGIANLILAIAIPLVTGWGYYGVAVAGVLILTFRHTLFIPWYVSRLLNIRMAVYLKSLVPGALAVLFIGGAAAGIAILNPLPSLFTLIIAGTVIMFVYGIVVLGFGLSPVEKQLFESYLPQGWRKAWND